MLYVEKSMLPFIRYFYITFFTWSRAKNVRKMGNVLYLHVFNFYCWVDSLNQFDWIFSVQYRFNCEAVVHEMVKSLCSLFKQNKLCSLFEQNQFNGLTGALPIEYL